ncbi:hypothetical protein [Blautia sp.]
MTKIKNTKKGMAKKTLSMSLVVAMLATSNVPVWAAEFSDGTDAAVTSEAEAPVVDTVDEFSDNEAEAPVVADDTTNVSNAQAEADYTVNTNMQLKSDTWAKKLSFEKKNEKDTTETFEITKGGIPVNTFYYEVYYNGDMKTRSDSAVDFLGLNNALASDALGAPGVDVYKDGKAVSIKLYYDKECKDLIYTFNTTLKAVDISSASFSTSSSAAYNGQYQSPSGITLNVGSTTASQANGDLRIVFENNKYAKDVGSYKYAIEGVAEKGYTGSTGYTGTFTIDHKTPDEKSLSVVLSGTAVYNGTNTLPTVTVTDKTTGETLPSSMYTVKWNTGSTPAAGTKEYTSADVTITMMPDNNPDNDKEASEVVKYNFSGNVPSACVTGSFKISALDLSTLGSKYTIKVDPQNSNGAAINNKTIDWSEVKFIDKATNKEVKNKDIAKLLPLDKLTAKITAKAGEKTGKLTIEATNSASTDIINKYEADVVVANETITAEKVSVPKGTKINGVDVTTIPSATVAADGTVKLNSIKSTIETALNASTYTGSALEPLKDVFENLVWTTTLANGEHQKLRLGTDYTITYADNTSSYAVSKKKATVTLTFIGDYAGSFSYEFAIQQATAYVEGKDVPYVAGKNLYDADVKVYTKDSKNNEVAVPTNKYTVTTTKKALKKGDTAEATVVFTDPNYKIKYVTIGSNGKPVETDLTDKNADNCAYVQKVESNVVGKSFKDASITATVEGSYTYTGATVDPKVVVKDGDVTLVEGTDYKIVSKVGVEAGDAYVTIQGIGNYDGEKTVKYTIAKADLANAVVESSKKDKANYDRDYTGLAQAPDIATAKDNSGKVYITGVKIGTTSLKEYDPITKKGDFILTYDETAVSVGTYNFTITAVPGNKNVQGTFKGTYKIKPATLTAKFAWKSDKTTTVETVDKADGTKKNPLSVTDTGAYYTGKAITLADFKKKLVVTDKDNNVLTEDKDYRLVYKNNIDAGIATVEAYGLGNYAAVGSDGKETVIATLRFDIVGKTIAADQIKKVSDVEYAGGLPVEPEVVVTDETGKTRLVQGKDYTVSTTVVEVGEYTYNVVKIKGKGEYVTADSNNTQKNAVITSNDTSTKWKVTKKNLANTTISVDKNNNVTVMNGSVVVPSSEYDVKFSEDGKKVTVTAKADSKNYTGSKELTAEVAKVGAPVISNVKVSGNKATVILSGEADEAAGYDYVISTSKDPSDKDARVDVIKNQVQTTSTFKYVQQGTYYAYCHAWKRDENGKKVFGEWSNVYPFSVTAITPDTPEILSVKTSGSTITVTYKESANSTGYDVVLGTGSKKEHGETRPYNYGTYKKLNVKTGVCKATFKNVAKGTYYVGVHSWNRSASENNNKVFSKWSNLEKTTVK